MGVISSKNQVTIPKRVLQEAGMAPGEDLRIVSAGPGRIELMKTDDLVDHYAGRLDKSTYPAGYLAGLRREWG